MPLPILLTKITNKGIYLIKCANLLAFWHNILSAFRIFAGEMEEGSVARDVGIILAAQTVHHYEIATYRGLTQFSKTLNLNKVADILHETFEEEKETDEKLTKMAEQSINVAAAAEVA